MNPSKRNRRKRKTSGSVTLADVARIADVGMTTVSRALNFPELVSPETLERVRAAISQTGYVPNLMAGGLASNRSRLVATIVPTIIGPIFSQCVQAIVDTMARAGYQVMLGESGYADSREEDLLATVISRRPDGIIIVGTDHSPATRRRLITSGIPVIEIWDLTSDPVDMLVGFSHEKVGVAVAEFLHARGVRKPGVISANDRLALQRVKGLVDTLRKLGLEDIPVCLTPAPAMLGAGRSGLAELLAKCPDLDAVACSSDFSAHGVLIEAQARGLAIPDQLAVVGFGDLSFAPYTHPTLSTVRVGGPEIGRNAAQMIIDTIEGRKISNRIMEVEFSIIQRSSA